MYRAHPPKHTKTYVWDWRKLPIWWATNSLLKAGHCIFPFPVCEVAAFVVPQEILPSSSREVLAMGTAAVTGAWEPLPTVLDQRQADVLAGKFPWLAVEFVRNGWTSLEAENWNKLHCKKRTSQVEEVDSSLSSCSFSLFCPFSLSFPGQGTDHIQFSPMSKNPSQWCSSSVAGSKRAFLPIHANSAHLWHGACRFVKCQSFFSFLWPLSQSCHSRCYCRSGDSRTNRWGHQEIWHKYQPCTADSWKLIHALNMILYVHCLYAHCACAYLHMLYSAYMCAG